MDHPGSGPPNVWLGQGDLLPRYPANMDDSFVLATGRALGSLPREALLHHCFSALRDRAAGFPGGQAVKESKAEGTICFPCVMA